MVSLSKILDTDGEYSPGDLPERDDVFSATASATAAKSVS
jgi:hypothetical protein